MLNTLIDLATKRYGRVTMVLSDLAKPGVWKDKLMIASEKLYDDDYKYIYLKAVVEVLSELDEEWGRYAREVYLVEQRLQKVFSSCSKKYPSTSDAELMENLTVLANLSPVDYEGDDIVEACFRICKAVVHAYMLETNYSGRLDNIRVDLCQKSQYVINTDSSEDHLLGENYGTVSKVAPCSQIMSEVVDFISKRSEKVTEYDIAKNTIKVLSIGAKLTKREYQNHAVRLLRAAADWESVAATEKCAAYMLQVLNDFCAELPFSGDDCCIYRKKRASGYHIDTSVCARKR